jgi:glycosyltransferase involved in cell wall biosynthesis
MTKVMHVITTLGPAGAETMLLRLVSAMDRADFESEVISLTDILELAPQLQAVGVNVRTLGMAKGIPNPLLVMRLAQWMRESKPDVVHTWMYHANLVGSLAARVVGNIPVVWGIHHSVLDPRVDKLRTLLINRSCASLSRTLPSRIVCCSEAALELHRKLGYANEKLEVIPNGFDLEQVRPDPAARESLRNELGVPADAIVIGIAARFHPHKDHRNFLWAAARLREKMTGVHFVLCGLNITWENEQLAGWIQGAGLRDCCHLLGVRQDMPRLFAGMDIATTASRTEAFPIVIGEAMACETPCVVTDVGDSAMIVGDTGIVVPPGNPDALAGAWRKLVEAGPEVRRRMGVAARNRVREHFALSAVLERYQSIYRQLAGGTRCDLVEAATGRELLGKPPVPPVIERDARRPESAA